MLVLSIVSKFYPPASDASGEVAYFFKKKNIHPPVSKMNINQSEG